MKLHTKAVTTRLERMHAALAKEADAAKEVHDSEARKLSFVQAERDQIPLSRTPPMALVRELDRLKRRVQHADWLHDKACTARNAVRDLATGGAIEL